MMSTRKLRFAIFGNVYQPKKSVSIQKILACLSQYEAEVFIEREFYTFITEGQQAYGTGNGKGAGYCEVGEMWAYFMQSTLMKDRYSGSLMHFGNMYWFKPDILLYLYERGMSRAEIYHALSGDVTSLDDLKDQLIALFPAREKLIVETFRGYGK